MSTTIISGGFPHLYRTDVSGAPIDASAVRSVARADVAELRANITPGIDEEPEHHLVNIAAKRALTVTEFKQMFYARGDGIFALSNVYECPNLSSNILASVWGKRVSYTKLGPGTPVEFTLRSIANVTSQSNKPANFFGVTSTVIYHGNPAAGDGIPKKTEEFTVWDAYGTPVTFEWSSSRPSGLILSQPGRTDNGVLPARVNVNNSGDFPPELGFSWIEIILPSPIVDPSRVALQTLGEFQIDSLADGTQKFYKFDNTIPYAEANAKSRLHLQLLGGLPAFNTTLGTGSAVNFVNLGKFSVRDILNNDTDYFVFDNTIVPGEEQRFELEVRITDNVDALARATLDLVPSFSIYDVANTSHTWYEFDNNIEAGDRLRYEITIKIIGNTFTAAALAALAPFSIEEIDGGALKYYEFDNNNVTNTSDRYELTLTLDPTIDVSTISSPAGVGAFSISVIGGGQRYYQFDKYTNSGQGQREEFRLTLSATFQVATLVGYGEFSINQLGGIVNTLFYIFADVAPVVSGTGAAGNPFIIGINGTGGNPTAALAEFKVVLAANQVNLVLVSPAANELRIAQPVVGATAGDTIEAVLTISGTGFTFASGWITRTGSLATYAYIFGVQGLSSNPAAIITEIQNVLATFAPTLTTTTTATTITLIQPGLGIPLDTIDTVLQIPGDITNGGWIQRTGVLALPYIIPIKGVGTGAGAAELVRAEMRTVISAHQTTLYYKTSDSANDRLITIAQHIPGAVTDTIDSVLSSAGNITNGGWEQRNWTSAKPALIGIEGENALTIMNEFADAIGAGAGWPTAGSVSQGLTTTVYSYSSAYRLHVRQTKSGAYNISAPDIDTLSVTAGAFSMVTNGAGASWLNPELMAGNFHYPFLIAIRPGGGTNVNDYDKVIDQLEARVPAKQPGISVASAPVVPNTAVIFVQGIAGSVSDSIDTVLDSTPFAANTGWAPLGTGVSGDPYIFGIGGGTTDNILAEIAVVIQFFQPGLTTTNPTSVTPGQNEMVLHQTAMGGIIDTAVDIEDVCEAWLGGLNVITCGGAQPTGGWRGGIRTTNDGGFAQSFSASAAQIAATTMLDATEIRKAINSAGGYHADVGAYPGSHPFPQGDKVRTWTYYGVGGIAVAGTLAGGGYNNADVKFVASVNSTNACQRPEPFPTVNTSNTGPGMGNLVFLSLGQSPDVPYNDSRVMNYNKLGGRPDDPSGVDLAYGYATDLQRNFYAQFEVMGNMERDLCLKRNCWTVCSRMSLEDQLYSLCFVAEECNDVCMKVTCARKWSEVEDALAESCIAENSTIGWGDHVDLYINVRVSNASPKIKDTIIRIRFPVQITRGPDDLGNWNVVASDAADAVITTGVGYDAPEGGNLQYRNAAQTEIHPDYMNQQQTQRWDSTRVHNTNQKIDPHDVVGNP